MGMKMFGLMALINMTVFLTISFFVLLALRKVEEKGLKIFGFVVVVLLWTVAGTILLTGVSAMCPMANKMMMGKGMCDRPGMMNKGRDMGGPGMMKDMPKEAPKKIQ